MIKERWKIVVDDDVWRRRREMKRREMFGDGRIREGSTRRLFLGGLFMVGVGGGVGSARFGRSLFLEFVGCFRRYRVIYCAHV